MADDNVDFRLMRALYERQSDEMARLKSGSGDGTFDGMDPWQTTVETRLGQLHSDVSGLRKAVESNFRWLLGAYGAGFVILAGMLISGYLMLADKLDALK